jgi:Tol biopolymer transport system component
VNQGDPSWSSDSETILFGQVPQDYGEADVPRHLHQYNIRTGITAQVPGSAGLYSPRWSPDGRYIAAMSIDSKNLMLFDTNTSRWSLLAVHNDVHNPFKVP